MSFLYIEYRQLYRYMWIKEIRYDIESDDRRNSKVYTFPNNFQIRFIQKEKRGKSRSKILDNLIIK